MCCSPQKAGGTFPTPRTHKRLWASHRPHRAAANNPTDTLHCVLPYWRLSWDQVPNILLQFAKAGKDARHAVKHKRPSIDNAALTQEEPHYNVMHAGQVCSQTMLTWHVTGTKITNPQFSQHSSACRLFVKSSSSIYEGIQASRCRGQQGIVISIAQISIAQGP